MSSDARDPHALFLATVVVDAACRPVYAVFGLALIYASQRLMTAVIAMPRSTTPQIPAVCW